MNKKGTIVYPKKSSDIIAWRDIKLLLVFIPCIIIVLGVLRFSEQNYKNLQEEDFQSYIETINNRKIDYDKLTPASIDYDTSQKCPYFTDKNHFCTIESFSKDEGYIMTEYRNPPPNMYGATFHAEKVKEIHYIDKDGKVFVKIKNK